MNIHKINKKISVFVCTLQTAVFCFSSVSFGAAYKDIPPTHWAYTAIENIYSKGYLKDFTSENFNPDGYIDKFTISRVLAIAANYKQGDYSSKNDIISKYSKKFSKWNTESNNQIAFLLSNNILLEEDLDSFMLFSDDGSEKFRAISREELAVFLVRLMKKTAEAESMKNQALFKDDSSITESRRGSINYLKSINILNGDNDGYCHPKNAITKAEFCVILNNTTELMAKSQPQTPTENNNSSVNNISSVSGTVNNYYKYLNVIQIKTGNEINTYRLSQTINIKMDGQQSSSEAILSGLYASAVINNSEIIELNLSKEVPPSETSTETATESSTETTTENNKVESNETDTQKKETNLCMDSSAKGTIQSISLGKSLKNECLIGILTDDDETKFFSATRYTIPVYSVRIGDSVEVNAQNGRISSIKLEKRNDKNIAQGYVTDIDEKEIVIKVISDEEKEFYYDENVTECFDCTTGKKIDFDDIKKYTEVYIFYEDEDSKKIDVIFVIDNL